MYPTLFGRSIIDVMPSATIGFQFSAKQEFAGRELGFAMRQASQPRAETNLLIRAAKDGHTVELVPPRLLNLHLPRLLVENYVHWYDIDKKSVEFRSRKGPWDTSP
ncbi:putative very large low complexity protein [Phaeoacremonium minimum UCRPA7]|uniref:Putative very large low complexity protein n=1 Tax=Phaeoacremonium minimum (strain UCR-PA7) TaxID=1286976 RepID=R8BD62_PHAM7|nr:putative very large low complexity protein [Phaeoacremonium minimum UCRPA7]EON97231.1 putative very large low complexity protein [Phaeoacremonium minimum UCRPA7]